MKKLLNAGPVFRLSVGVVSLLLALVMVFDALLNILPSEHKQLADVRRQVSVLIGSEINAALNTNVQSQLNATVERIVRDTHDVESIGVRHDKKLVAASPNHDKRWLPEWTGESTLTHVVVPIMTGKERWGDIEILFAEPDGGPFWNWLHQPSVVVTLLISTIGFAAVYAYLRRALNYLDPSQAVPQRVRKAFDTLTEAVVILDQKARVMLANDAFHRMHGTAQQDEAQHVEGKPITNVAWLIEGLTRDAKPLRFPWDMVMHSSQAIRDMELTVTLPDGATRELRLNCSAISDGAGTSRGCLVSFADVTALTETNAMLQHALKDLEDSRDKIQAQHDELQKVANFDPLTGCLNRRAFFARAEPLFEKATQDGGELVCIMGDIDFFKSFNDRFGHAVGDQVIQQVAGALRRSLRETDLLCRFGGEEFCLLLVDIEEPVARKVGERIRAKIEQDCGRGVRSIPGLQVTSSFGMAALSYDRTCTSLSFLIERADEALYAAKKGGRNRVMTSSGDLIAMGEPPVQPMATAAH
jgi:diguanylate cyclase (GGDEF)-like protein/PAS domain S-box-containing protein